MSVIPSEDKLKCDNLVKTAQTHMLALFKDKDLPSHSDLDSSLDPPPSKKSKAALTLGKKQSSSSTTLTLETRARNELDLYLKSRI